MAETASSDAASAATAAPRPIDLTEIGETAMALADQRGWAEVSLFDVARAAGVPLAELYRHCRSKRALLEAYARRIDERVLANVDPEDLEEPAKDRLFELLMERFDALKPHRRGLRSVLASVRRDPANALGGLTQLRRSMRAMLEGAGLSTSGLRGELRLDGLCGVYLNALRAFVDDDTEDLSRTMAALDRTLQRVERPAQVLEGEERPDRVLRERVGERVRDGLQRSGLGSRGGSDHAGPTLEGEAVEVAEPFDGTGPEGDPMAPERP